VGCLVQYALRQLMNQAVSPYGDLVIGAGWTEVVALAAAFVIAVAATPAGISGAVLLLPFQVSLLGTPSPAVTPTNLLYNVVATPGALYRRHAHVLLGCLRHRHLARRGHRLQHQQRGSVDDRDRQRRQHRRGQYPRQVLFIWAYNGTPAWHAEQVSTGFGTYTGASLAANDGAATIAAQGTHDYLTFFWAAYGTGTWHASSVAGTSSTFSVPSLSANDNSANISAAGPGGRLMFYWNANGNPAWHPETVAGAGSV
jgi:hypothetical protein